MFIADNIQNKINSVDIVLGDQDDLTLININEIIIHTHNNTVFSSINTIKSYELTAHELIADIYILKFHDANTFDIVEIVNELNRKSEIEYAEPNFLLLITPFNSDSLIVDNQVQDSKQLIKQ